MADKSSQLILGALSRAATDAAVPLHGSKTNPGLFPTTAAGRQAAQRCLDEGYLAPADSASGALTDKGLTYLLGQVSPRQVLEDFVRAAEAQQGHVAELADAARRLQGGLEALRGRLESVLAQVVRPPAGDGHLAQRFREFLQKARPTAEMDPSAVLLAALAAWPTDGAAQDYPLPELYRRTTATSPGLTIGQFHDTLRRLARDGQLILHPWTGPLYALPEPPFALLVGHEVLYYASARSSLAA